MRLLRFARNDTLSIVFLTFSETSYIESNRKVVYKIFAQRFKGMPLKVVYVEEEGDVVILSAYPLKKSYWRKTL